MNIRILGAHNAETQNSRCACLLIDGTLAVDAGGLTSTLSLDEQRRIEAVLLSHQHYDHIRDVPVLALNVSLHGGQVNVYSAPEVWAAIETHLLNGLVYPKFHELPIRRPTVNFNVIEAGVSERIDGHKVMALRVKHCAPTFGYQVSDTAGKSVFYTADTGPGLADCWNHVAPDLLIAEVTLSNVHQEFALFTGHLTPRLLEQELVKFRECQDYLPRVVVVHMDPSLEGEIRGEVAAAAKSLNTTIDVAYEGMEIDI